ncbi:TetR/AcrR family transcriptional regulator [Paenirhodobacter sp.]|uniref:TetR/AcrR family transcriptional regulator n=1 Tax=Paenirhodobacter sp. TaxID=1965326 RepID=UPI003B3FD3FE
MAGNARPLRADAERSVRAILEAAERVLRADPAASLAQIAEAAGVARTTIHRRFSSREALLDALRAWSVGQFNAAVDDARPEASPPMVALYQLTLNILRAKIAWSYGMAQAERAGPAVPEMLAAVTGRCEKLFERMQAAGLITENADLHWALRVYRALIAETLHGEKASGDADADVLATRIVATLMQGIGTEAARL